MAKRICSVTFDDGHQEQWMNAVPILNKYKIKGTFYIATLNVKDWIPWREAAEEGHEIGSHTLFHPKLTEISSERLRIELLDSKNNIEDEIGKECISFAYPYGIYNKKVIQEAAKHYRSARSVLNGINKLPVKANRRYELRIIRGKKNIATIAKNTQNRSGLYIILFHQ